MKQWMRGLAVIAALLCVLSSVASADALREKTFVYNGARWPSSNTGVATFWEAPALSTGESYTEGVLTLENAADETVTLTLTKLDLPYDNEEQLAYLTALQLQIRQEDTTVYDGSYAYLLSSDRPALQVELAPGEACAYTVTLSCPFSYAGEITDFPVVAWTFDSTVEVWEEPEEPSTPDESTATPAGWPLDKTQTIALVCGVVAVAFLALAVVLLVGLIRKKRAKRARK